MESLPLRSCCTGWCMFRGMASLPEIPAWLPALNIGYGAVAAAPRDPIRRFELVSPPLAAFIIKGETDENKSGFVD